MNNEKPVKYAIIGLGFISQRHIKAIEETGGELVLTCDIDPAKNADFTDYKEMIKSPKFAEVDCVIIATPNYLHAEMARACSGKVVFCEKPLTISKDYDGLEDVNNILQLRYSKVVQEILDYEPDTISITLSMKRGEEYWNGWKGDVTKSGGLVYNLAIHYLDLLIYVLGEPVEILSNYVSEDKIACTVQFEKGVGSILMQVGDYEPARLLNAGKGDDFKVFNLSNKENLSYEDLHKEVYKAVLNKEGLKLSDIKPTLDLAYALTYYGVAEN